METKTRKPTLDELASSLSPEICKANGLTMNESNDGCTFAEGDRPKPYEAIEKAAQDSFIDNWDQKAEKNTMQLMGEVAEKNPANLNKSIVTYEYRHNRNWSEADLAKMDAADSDENLIKKGSFVKW